ncbi:hypothetical protein BpHYR1_036324 [Brachionus plicatilis]|uniref:Uncharacterized protein n=1 Tax=Brachionus plicatilis TaxID=10195 RepID=A0A3M7PW37_BRAPC|nr:hypothetical protein BpHYR1_036324 [Brachionus plicatilis]
MCLFSTPFCCSSSFTSLRNCLSSCSLTLLCSINSSVNMGISKPATLVSVCSHETFAISLLYLSLSSSASLMYFCFSSAGSSFHLAAIILPLSGALGADGSFLRLFCAEGGETLVVPEAMSFMVFMMLLLWFDLLAEVRGFFLDVVLGVVFAGVVGSVSVWLLVASMLSSFMLWLINEFSFKATWCFISCSFITKSLF